MSVFWTTLFIGFLFGRVSHAGSRNPQGTNKTNQQKFIYLITYLQSGPQKLSLSFPVCSSCLLILCCCHCCAIL